MTLKSGYAYVLERSGSGAWIRSADSAWWTEVITPTGNEKFVGVRLIDGGQVIVFQGEGDMFYAQTRAFLGGMFGKP